MAVILSSPKNSAMFCSLCNLSITKPIVVTNATLPQNPDSSSSSSSSSPQQTNLPRSKKPSLGPTNSTTSSPPNKLPRRPPQPSIMQIERALGAGSFRDGEPDLKYTHADFSLLFLSHNCLASSKSLSEF